MVLFLLGCNDRGLQPPVPVEADPARVVSLAGRDYLVGLGGATPSGDWAQVGTGPDQWVASTADVDATRAIGTAWRVGDVECRVDGYAAVVEEYLDVYVDGEGNRIEAPTAPGCGTPLLYARLRCEGETSEELANPGLAPAILAPTRERVVDEQAARAEAVVRSLPEWAAAQAAAADAAVAAGVDTAESTQVDRYVFGFGAVTVVDTAVMSGDGRNYCGGDEFYARWIVAVADDGAVLFKHERDDLAEIVGAVDTDGDHLPELRLAWWGGEFLVAPDGSSRALSQFGMCVCGC
ncbi:hypothetical protein LBMAG42_15680 [Deltaproteobacteria bacterium]|nr:hypothetical protein LBMAG42_15680 [Deltaproteobacteria bacterium]